MVQYKNNRSESITIKAFFIAFELKKDISFFALFAALPN